MKCFLTKVFSILLILVLSMSLLTSCIVINNETTYVMSNFEIHFIDVGQADAALVLCDDKAMLIDGGNVADSDVLYTYLKKNNISHLDYVVATH